MNALTPKEVADLRLWRPGEPGLIHVPFRLWERILDALDPEGASAEPGGGAPAESIAEIARRACGCVNCTDVAIWPCKRRGRIAEAIAAERETPPRATPSGLGSAPTPELGAPESSEAGGGGAPAAGEREARVDWHGLHGALRDYIVARYETAGCERTADELCRIVATALRAPAPPTPPAAAA